MRRSRLRGRRAGRQRAGSRGSPGSDCDAGFPARPSERRGGSGRSGTSQQLPATRAGVVRDAREGWNASSKVSRSAMRATNERRAAEKQNGRPGGTARAGRLSCGSAELALYPSWRSFRSATRERQPGLYLPSPCSFRVELVALPRGPCGRTGVSMASAEPMSRPVHGGLSPAVSPMAAGRRRARSASLLAPWRRDESAPTDLRIGRSDDRREFEEASVHSDRYAR